MASLPPVCAVSISPGRDSTRLLSSAPLCPSPIHRIRVYLSLSLSLSLSPVHAQNNRRRMKETCPQEEEEEEEEEESFVLHVVER